MCVCVCVSCFDLIAITFCLQYHEFLGYCTVPVWNGGHDHAANSAQRYRSLQPDGFSGMTHFSF